MPTISAVVPCYNEEEALPLFVAEFQRVAEDMRDTHSDLRFELVLIDDGSQDGTLGYFKQLGGATYDWLNVRWVSFSRNFGKEAALFAGLQHVTGDYVATMDADMQDPPSMLPEMYEILLTQDYDSVATRRETREGEPVVRSFFARMFYRIINKLSDADIVDGARDFRLMKRVVVDAILAMGEYNRFSKGIYGWVGFKTKWLAYENVERVAGESKWSFWSLFGYAIDGIVAFSTNPLSIASKAGVILCLVSFIAVIFVVVRAALFGDAVAGWPSMMAVILFVGGLQLLCLGILGQYLAKTYLETKQRPQFIVRESNIADEE